MIRCLSLATLLVLLACGGDSRSGDNTEALEPVRTDSAGVTLLVHDRAAFDRAPRIELDSIPLAEIVGSAEDEAADISTIDPLLILADGRIVGRDRQRGVLVVFSADGSSRREFGRSGAGPGEFGFISRIVVGEGGQFLVSDPRNGRVSIFDPDEGLQREIALADAMGIGASSPLGMRHGTIALWGINFDQSGGDNPVPPGVKTATLDVASGQLKRRFVTGPEETEAAAPRVIQLPGGGTAIAVMAISAGGALTEFPSVVGWDGDFVVADPNRYQFEWRDSSGVVSRLLRVTATRVAVTDQIWNAHVDARVAEFGSGGTSVMMIGGQRPEPEEIRRRIASEPHADSLPGFTRAEYVSDGTLWVVDYPVPGRDGWGATAFSPDGRIIGRLAEASGQAPVRFGSDRAIFRTEDELGIATFTVRKLVFQR